MDDEEIQLPQSKQCLCCKQMKSVKCFNEYNKSRDGYYIYCIECQTRKERSIASAKRGNNPKRYANYQMKALHLTGKDY